MCIDLRQNSQNRSKFRVLYAKKVHCLEKVHHCWLWRLWQISAMTIYCINLKYVKLLDNLNYYVENYCPELLCKALRIGTISLPDVQRLPIEFKKPSVKMAASISCLCKSADPRKESGLRFFLQNYIQIKEDSSLTWKWPKMQEKPKWEGWKGIEQGKKSNIGGFQAI